MYLALHIPDGFLTPAVCVAGWVLAALLLTVALARTRASLGERQVPLMGVMGAFIFAAQAINIPIAGGTSGHLLGSALAAIVLGPWCACVVMACVVGLQGLLYADGGLLAMGWNIVNMGILAAFTGWLVERDLARVLPRSLAVFGGAWLSVVASATATSLELAASGTAPLAVVLPAMVSVHLVLGIGEGLATAAAVAWIARARPQAMQTADTRGASLVGHLALAALGLCLAAPLASALPDGLESVAQRYGFGALAREGAGPLAEYRLPFLGTTPLSTICAMVIGAIALWAACSVAGRLLARRRTAVDG